MAIKRVIGVRYDMEDIAPVVVVKGAGADARHVLDVAQARGDVSIVKDPDLLQQLYRVPVESPIGRELFPVMASLLAYIIQADRSAGEDSWPS